MSYDDYLRSPEKVLRWLDSPSNAATAAAGCNADILAINLLTHRFIGPAKGVNIAAKFAGRIAEILVNEGDFVTAGQVVARMDTAVLEAQLAQAKAQLRQTQNAQNTAALTVTLRESEKVTAKATVDQRQAELTAATRRFSRTENLAKSNVLTPQELDDDRATKQSAQAALAAAQSQVIAAEAAIQAAKSQVIEAESAVEAAKAAVDALTADIRDSLLMAPRSGRVLVGAALIRERERGTIGHLLVMPVTPFEIMASKVWSMGLLVLAACAFALSFIVQGLLSVPIKGSMGLFLTGTALHLFATTSLGIFMGTVARSMPQFGLLLILALLPMQMLSGGQTPRESMPALVQYFMLAAPNTHYVMLAQAIRFRGAGIQTVWVNFVALAAIGGALFFFSLARLRKSLSEIR